MIKRKIVITLHVHGHTPVSRQPTRSPFANLFLTIICTVLSPTLRISVLICPTKKSEQGPFHRLVVWIAGLFVRSFVALMGDRSVSETTLHRRAFSKFHQHQHQNALAHSGMMIHSPHERDVIRTTSTWLSMAEQHFSTSGD